MEYRIDWIARWAEYSPIKIAVRDADTDESYTYGQLNQLSQLLADHFSHQFGIKKGDRIAVLAEYTPDYIVLFAAAMKLGFILVPLNYRLSGRELDYILDNAGASFLIVEEKYLPLLEGQPCMEKIGSRMGMVELNALLGSFEGKKLDRSQENQATVSADDPLFILYTSGTTGFPKGAIYTHAMAFWNSINTQLRLDITAADHTLVCMPPFHTGGWNVLLSPFLHHGASFTLLRKFEADRVLHLLEDEEATLFMGVPTMLKMMADDPAFDQVSLNALRYFIVGGEAMPIPLIEQWQQKGVPIRQGYGLTEVGPNVTSLHHDDALRKIGSIGKPNFYVETRLVTESGGEAAPEEEGELWLKGPMVTPGYWNNAEATEKSIENGWFKTGDVLIRDAEGYLYVKDRIKNMFISGGENVYPAEVEKFLQTHPGIQEVAVVGVADEKWGEVGKALIVKKMSDLSAEDILDFCRGKLAKFKVPKHIHFVTEIPKTDSGKIDRKRLGEV